MYESKHFFIVCGIPLMLIGIVIALLFIFIKSRKKALEESQEVKDCDGPEKIFLKESCPICLNDICFAVVTECGHLFCGLCYKRYSEEQNDLCPVCRQKVEKIYAHFTDEEKTTDEDIGQEVNDFVQRYSVQNMYDYEQEEEEMLQEYYQPLYPFNVPLLPYHMFP